MKKLLVFLSATVILAGCSPKDLFSMLAQSEVEQAAGDSIKAADQAVLEFDEIVTQKTAEFDKVADLTAVVEGISYGSAFINEQTSGSQLSHQVWAILPPLEEDGAFYEGWLVDPNTKKFVSTGPMSLSEDGKMRSLAFSSLVNYSSYKKVVITKELVRDDTPELHILEGVFR